MASTQLHPALVWVKAGVRQPCERVPAAATTLLACWIAIVTTGPRFIELPLGAF